MRDHAPLFHSDKRTPHSGREPLLAMLASVRFTSAAQKEIYWEPRAACLFKYTGSLELRSRSHNGRPEGTVSEQKSL